MTGPAAQWTRKSVESGGGGDTEGPVPHDASTRPCCVSQCDSGHRVFSCLPTTPGMEVIYIYTKLDVAHQAPQYLQPQLAFMPKAL
jgi:hypothetical protein